MFTKNKKLSELNEHVEKRREVRKREKTNGKTQLKLNIDPELKKVLQDTYGKNLSALFEEEMLARLKRDNIKAG